ncbi:MAG: hypothetical protein ACLTEE_14345 [Anaerobutyricum hallii]
MKFFQQYGTSISIVLLDIVMPVVDGFEVLDFTIEVNIGMKKFRLS